MIEQNLKNPCLFGFLADGRAVEKITISHGALRAEILTLGAIIRDLRFEGHPSPLVLGLNNVEDYLAHSRYFGATAGRCANRIAGGQFTLDGISYQLECNGEDALHHLHGGSTGMADELWQIKELTSNRVVLWIRDKQGNAGYPGNVETTCSIEISDTSTLTICYESHCDKPTPVNICHHSYFNFGSRSDIRDHSIRIMADHYLATDRYGIPLGAPQDVANTPFDLREKTLLEECFQKLDNGFDHNFCLSLAPQSIRPVAYLWAPTGLCMEIATTEPGIQLYTAATLDCPVAGLEGRRYGAFAGLCLETQIWPDAINRPDFPEVVLRPGEIRRQETSYHFSLT